MVKKKDITNKIKKYLEDGIISAKNGNLEEAYFLFNRAISEDKQNFKAYINLSNLEIIKGNFTQAINILKNYIDIFGFEINIINHIGKICSNYKLDKDLLSLFEFCKINSKKIENKLYFLYFLKGIFLEREKNYKEAIQFYELSIKCNSNFDTSYINILHLLEQTNKLEKFDFFLKESEKLITSKDYNKYFYYFQSLLFTRIAKYKESLDIIEKFNLLIKFQNHHEIYLRLLNIISKNHEKIKNFKLAFEAITKRNISLLNSKDNQKYEPKEIFDTIKKYKKFYTKKNVNYINAGIMKYPDINLLFLVGFPRSGTTLLDTILRTHSRIKVLEEEPILYDCRKEFFESRNNNLLELKNITNVEKNKLRNNYFKKTLPLLEKSQNTIIDKLPLSIIEIGFIRSLFPESKIILALRHPCDVVLSCYFSHFTINHAMANFLNWEKTIDFYNKVFDLFEFYERELKINYFKIKYENVVKNFKIEISLLLEFLNLKYEEKLESFFLTAKKRDRISTPSYSQVINPLYASSIGRWKDFKNIKNPELALKKWINKFDY